MKETTQKVGELCFAKLSKKSEALENKTYSIYCDQIRPKTETASKLIRDYFLFDTKSLILLKMNYFSLKLDNRCIFDFFAIVI